MSAARRRKKIRKRAEAMLAIATACIAVSGSLRVLETLTAAFAEGLRIAVADYEREARAQERMVIGVPAFDDLPPGVSRT